MSKISELNFLLEKKYEELDKIRLDTFTLKKEILLLLNEISEIEEIIKEEKLNEKSEENIDE